MKKFDKSFRRSSGFTLIELLIVIVIIGILAGILIAVINPVRQQNRSRNAGIKAGILKAAFSVNAVRAGTGNLPSGTALTEEMENITVAPIGANGCSTTNTLNCKFQISGTILPVYCETAEAVVPTAGQSGQCYFHVISTSLGNELTAGAFRIAAAQFDLDPRIRELKTFVFDSNRGLLECINVPGWATDVSSCQVLNQ